MKRAIVTFKGALTYSTVDKSVEIPDGAIVTITTCCGDCDFREDAASGTKPVCSHRGILASRPYSTGEQGRNIDRTTIPTWCPLRAKGV